jgi:hypothetical protein
VAMTPSLVKRTEIAFGGSRKRHAQGAGWSRSLGGGEGSDRIRARDGNPDLVAGGVGYDWARIDAGLDAVASIEVFF